MSAVERMLQNHESRLRRHHTSESSLLQKHDEDRGLVIAVSFLNIEKVL